MFAMITVFYLLSEAGRRASLLEGGTGKEEQTVEVPVTPERLAVSRVSRKGEASLHIGCSPVSSVGCVIGYKVEKDSFSAWRVTEVRRTTYQDVPPADPEAFVDTEVGRRQELAALKAAAEAECAAKIAAFEASENARRVKIVEDYLAGGDSEPGNRTLECVSEETRAAVAAEVARRKKERDERKEAEWQEQEAAEKTAKAEQELWVIEHGSERLKLIAAAGLLDASHAVYRDERMAIELPGWKLEPDEISPDDIRNPEFAVLQAHKAALLLPVEKLEMAYFPYPWYAQGLRGRYLGAWVCYVPETDDSE